MTVVVPQVPGQDLLKMTTQDGPDTRGGESDTHARQVPPLCAGIPGRVLPSAIEGRDIPFPTGDAGRPKRRCGLGPWSADKISTPTAEGLGLNEKSCSANRREHPALLGEHCSVPWAQSMASDLGAATPIPRGGA